MGLWQSGEAITVLVQSRAKPVGGMLLSLAIVMAALAMPHHRYVLDRWVPAEWLLGALGVAGLVWMGAMALWPNRLILSPHGLDYHQFFRVRSLPWAAIQAADVWGTEREPYQGVRLELTFGGSLRLSGGWPLDAQALAARIEEARRRHDRGEARLSALSKVKSAHGALF
jgi:hypothetical protein